MARVRLNAPPLVAGSRKTGIVFFGLEKPGTTRKPPRWRLPMCRRIKVTVN